ncbi:MAG: carbon-nitrogen family hydrolase [Dehalococcoidales bacterium]|nr:carbon-nitrogen family hydrolase [Dehalococcoidales bacterium]
MIKVASIQLQIADGESKKDRVARVERIIDGLGEVDLIVLPEIWNVGYFSFEAYEDESETLDGETSSRMAAKAQMKGAYLLAGSIVEKAKDGLYNTSALFDRKGQLVATYRKIHLFGYGSAETRVLRPGREVVVANTELGNLGLSTCYDLRFPELYRQMIDKGAELFLVASAWPYPRLEHWKTLNVVRAFENESFLISSNCVGVTRGKQFLGHSAIVDPWGTVIASGGDFECVLKAEIDREMVGRVRAEFPPLRDRVL